MADILSQAEMDALLQSARRVGASREPADQAGKQAVRYNFKQQADYIAKEHLRSLHLVHEQFAATMSSSLTVSLRALTAISLDSIKSQPFAEFLGPLQEPTVIVTTAMKPLDATGVIVYHPSIVFPLIDLTLGGPGVASNINRAITEIEWQIFETIAKTTLDELRQAWLPFLPEISFKAIGHETRPQMIGAIAQHETVLTFSFTLKVGDCSGTLHLCLPAVSLKPFIDRFESAGRTEPRQVRTSALTTRLIKLVRAADVVVTAEIHGTHLSVKELLQLREGDVLRLDHRLSDPLTVAVNSREKFTGRIGTREGRKTLAVVQPVE